MRRGTSTSMESAGDLPARGSRATTLRYARCPPSRNHVSLEIKEFAAPFHAILIQRRERHMPLVSMRQLLDEAAKGGYGVGAFNVNDMEQIQAIMEAGRETQSPVIVQASRGARAYSQDRFLYHLMIAATEVYPELPIVLHLDHGNSVATCKSAIDMGFTSVMMDGSLMEDGKTPSSFE